MFNTDLDNRNQRSYKRELELFANEVQDSWEHDDNEYLSRREQQEENDVLRRNIISGTSKEEKKEDNKRWLNVDKQSNGKDEQTSERISTSI